MLVTRAGWEGYVDVGDCQGLEGLGSRDAGGEWRLDGCAGRCADEGMKT